MDLYQVKRLKEEHQKGLYFCEENIKKWEKFKTDYEVLKERLETLPDSLSYDVTVPFGNNAFTKGKLVHTNEIMVLLGDNWFAEVSAKQAVAIATRRILQCTKMLEDFSKEKKQFENWLKYIGEVSGNEELVEIFEHYDEEKEKLWREQHAKNAKSYRQKMAEKKIPEEDFISKLDELELAEMNGAPSSTLQATLGNEELVEVSEVYDEEKEKSWQEQHAKNVKLYPQNLAEKEISEDDYISKMGELELAEMNGVDNSDEDSKSELNSEEIETMDSIRNSTECSDEGSHSEEHPEKNVLKLRLNCNARKTSESETGDDYDDNRKRDTNEDAQDDTSPKNGKHVRWQDLSKQNIKRITFKHSKPKKPNTPSSKYKVVDSSEDENHPLIQSPSDIYKHFGNLFQSSPPKSILKVKTPSPSADMNFPIFPTKEDIACKESSPETDDSTNLQPFTGEVRERSSPIDIVEPKSSRPMSHFKSSRKNRKR